MNVLNPKNKESKRKIIKERAGELAHIDAHHLPKGIIEGDSKNKYYCISIIDDASRVCWTEITTKITALDTMFASLACINRIYECYKIKFEKIMSDNGNEFKARSDNRDTANNHPFQRLMQELEIKQIFTKPYRPQTNGKIERYWRTFDDEVIEGSIFKNIDELRDVVLKYNFYYNDYRIHQGIGNITPKEMLSSLEKI